MGGSFSPAVTTKPCACGACLRRKDRTREHKGSMRLLCPKHGVQSFRGLDATEMARDHCPMRRRLFPTVAALLYRIHSHADRLRMPLREETQGKGRAGRQAGEVSRLR